MYFNRTTYFLCFLFAFCVISPVLADEYTVKSGDVLSVIADHYGLTSEDLARANGFSSDHVLMPGDVIYIPVQNNSSSGYSATVNASDVNLRSGPSLQDGIICVLNKGEQVSIIEDRGQWCYIRLSDGYEGWIKGDFLGGSSSSVPSSSYTPKHYIKKSYIYGEEINVRKKPSFDSGILFTVSNNEKIYVLDRRGDWIYVAFSDGVKGWIYYDYIECYAGQPSTE